MWRFPAEFDPVDRTDPDEEGIQSWEVPGYTVFDLHASLRISDLISVWRGGDVRLFANVFNVFDELYISDADDNDYYNGYDGDHDADDAAVFLGFPRTFNVGFEVRF